MLSGGFRRRTAMIEAVGEMVPRWGSGGKAIEVEPTSPAAYSTAHEVSRANAPKVGYKNTDALLSGAWYPGTKSRPTRPRKPTLPNRKHPFVWWRYAGHALRDR